MGIRKIKGIEKFVFETDEERDVLEMARNYFGESSSFIIDGLGYKMKKTSAPSRFRSIRKGIYTNGSPCSITIEQWKQIQDYASRRKEGAVYVDLPLTVRP